MRHRVAGVKLGRTPAHRRALFRNLVTALLEHEAIRTTDAKAKELRRWGDQMITLGKQGTLHARRRAAVVVQRASVLKKLFDEIAPRYAERHGGYTRVVKLGHRVGDAAHLSVVELVERKGSEAEQASPKKKPARRRDTAAKDKGKATAKTKTEPRRRKAAAG
jgi:large subunit ribosomal protein L17